MMCNEGFVPICELFCITSTVVPWLGGVMEEARIYEDSSYGILC
jgi:hypothetical protein